MQERLPRELRDMVYQHLVDNKVVTHICRHVRHYIDHERIRCPTTIPLLHILQPVFMSRDTVLEIINVAASKHVEMRPDDYRTQEVHYRLFGQVTAWLKHASNLEEEYSIKGRFQISRDIKYVKSSLRGLSAPRRCSIVIEFWQHGTIVPEWRRELEPVFREVAAKFKDFSDCWYPGELPWARVHGFSSPKW